ncbi:MAG TPA: hypothetical protein VGS00_02585 [Thermoanaerobaculia bacterium]|nr:hypothetical protein [Thermoanaerobaculia bacterium]
MDAKVLTAHLTDAELFGLALPPAGEPEALPDHLSECGACGRALQNWKTAVRELAQGDAGPIDRRTPAEWRAAEERTLAAIRTARLRRRFPLRWAAGLAAAVLVAVLLLPVRASLTRGAAPAVPASESSELSAGDRADDTLLHDVNRMARGDAGGVWNVFAAEPGESPAAEDHRL